MQVAVDAAGNVYVADTYNYSIRKIAPTALAVGHGQLCVADLGSGRVRQIRLP